MLLGTQTEMDKSMNEKKIFHQAVGFIFNLRLLSASIYIITWIAYIDINNMKEIFFLFSCVL